MRKPEEPRFTPQHRNSTHASSKTSAPRWFIREAVRAFGLSAFDVAVFYAIADNLDADGISRTATSLVVDRLGVSRTTVVKSVAVLLQHRLIVELDEKRSGAIMRYMIPKDRPLTNREIGV